MTPTPDPLALVHQGWDHLKHQRPLAAWASWQRALRIKPGDPAATQALQILAAADELPAAARESYRFRPPKDERQRSNWNARLSGNDLDDLLNAAQAFGDIADADPS